MLVLRLLVMVLTIICLMDGHAEVTSSTTAMRNGGESSSVKQNEPEVQILDRKKKKKPKPGKKKKPKPNKPNKKKKQKPNKAKPTPTKPVTTTPTISTSTMKTTTITTTARTTTTTVSPTTTATTAKTTTSTVSATTTLSTTTSATTTVKTTAATSTATTTTTTISTTATTSSPATTAATTADSGAGGECKATNGKPCIFPFKDGNEEYNECKNEGGKYFWCATSVYDSGKYKHWSYCPNDGSCPIPGDGECRATNNKPCVFPFKDGNKEYNECADHGGKYFWCATGTNSAGKYTAWSECPKDGSCPLPPKSTPPGATSTLTIATTTLPNTASSMPVTTVSPQESASITVLVKDGEKIFSCQMDFTFESTSGFKMNSNFSSSCSPSSSATKHYKNFDEYAFDITTSSGAEINCKINIAIQDETSGISMATKPMEKSLDCSVDESKCVTISGEHFPTTCVVPFIHEGRKYQACTDKGGKDAGKLWCATAVDDNEEMTKWGYCSTACGYCGGKDVTDQDTRAGGACGYDCFINPYKPMEPKTQGIDPRLLSGPEVSYYDDEMTVWNKLPNIQFQFLQGQPGIFLNCLDGFNHFPCHQSVYIKCDGNYRFSIYAAELKDDKTATIGKFIQNDVKNVQIGCGPCPMGFIYKVGDEISTYLDSWGKYNGVPDIAACRDLCNDRNCPTFVYSLEDKYCELHSVRVENPSNPVFKDYRLCAREEENSCEKKLTLVCPDGYSEKSNAPSFYLIKDWTYNEDAEDEYVSANACATECEQNTKCDAVVSTICKGCQLLTKEDSAQTPREKVNHYCLYGNARSDKQIWRAYTLPANLQTNLNGLTVPVFDGNWPPPKNPKKITAADWTTNNKMNGHMARQEIHKPFSFMSSLTITPETDFATPTGAARVVAHCRIPVTQDIDPIVAPLCDAWITKNIGPLRDNQVPWMDFSTIALVAGPHNPCTWNFIIETWPNGPLAYMQHHGGGHKKNAKATDSPDFYPHWHIRQALVNGVEYAQPQPMIQNLRSFFGIIFNDLSPNRFVYEEEYIGLCPVYIKCSSRYLLFPQDDKDVKPSNFEALIELISGEAEDTTALNEAFDAQYEENMASTYTPLGVGLELKSGSAAGYDHYVYK